MLFVLTDNRTDRGVPSDILTVFEPIEHPPEADRR